jgi:non-specific serine/threonine protein kinase
LQNTRLLTLTGPGGTGKTRLSLQLAAEILDQFSDGVWLVELAPLADPALVAQSMAGTLGVHQQPGRPLLATLGDYLRSKRLLLVLDNCEHLLDACAELADALLRAAPHLKIMTSSREVLGIAGEVAYRVPPLALPESAEASPRMLLRSDCVRLFYERAQAANSAFVLTEQNARAIVEICRRLDGIPLAIELAAARVRLLKVEQIASRLDDRFRLLSGGSRTALPRQQTLQALIDWSWDLLESRDQILLRRLAVFSGGWTLEAAEFICTDSSPAAPAARPKEEPSTHTFDSGNVLDLLGELVDKSLVVVLEQEKKTRFDMLQTIRQYALERLVAASEAALVRDRHLRYYGELGERAERHLLGPQQIEWLKQLDDDRDNLREAVRWGITANPEQALRLCGAIGSYWVRRGLAREGYELTHAALTTDATRPLRADQTDDIRRAARARALAGISLVSVALGLNDESAKAGLEAAELFRTLGDTERQVLAISSAVTAHGLLGDEATAEALAQDAIFLAQRLGGPDARRISVQMRARAAFFRGAKPEGEQLLLDGLQMVRELGPTWESAMILLILGIVAEDQGRVADARDYFLESEQIFRDLGDRHFVNMAVSERAHLERRTGRLPAAIDLYRQTLPRWQELGHRPAVAHQLESMAQVFLSQEGPEQSRAARLERAALLLGAAERIRQESGSVPTGLESEEYDDMVMRMREQMGKSAMERGRLQGRAMSLDDAVTFALEPHEVGGPDVGLQGSGANA